MAINSAGQTVTQSRSDGIPKFANGSVVFDATAITAADYVTITIGFVPRYIQWQNDTSRIMIEWREGMAQDSCIKAAAAGTRTLEVTGGNHGFIVGTGALTSANSGTVPVAGQFQVSQNATLAAILASQTCRWTAWG